MATRLLLVCVLVLSGLVACGGGARRVTPPPPVQPATPPTPEPVAQPTVPSQEVVALVPIYFDFDKYDIRPDQRAPLANNAKILQGQTGITRVVIEGHCDERGTNEYNMALGQRRADSVKNYLINYGIDRAKLATVSYGEERPVDPGHNEEAWARNRRAEFVIQK